MINFFNLKMIQAVVFKISQEIIYMFMFSLNTTLLYIIMLIIRSLTGIVGSNPTGDMDVCLL
jgi:hypothetical protein